MLKFLYIAGIIYQGRMSLFCSDGGDLEDRRLVVYEPDIEACVRLVDQEATGELCKLPIYYFRCC